MSKEVYRHLKETCLYTRDKMAITHPITEDMFGENDIESILILEDGLFYVNFYGINGTIPSSFFDKPSKNKIIGLYKKLNSPLWKTLNDSK